MVSSRILGRAANGDTTNLPLTVGEPRTEVVETDLATLWATQEHGWRRLGLCAGDDCQDVYLDEAGRGTRRYCSATCLNRARVRAFRSRRRAGAVQVDNPQQ